MVPVAMTNPTPTFISMSETVTRTLVAWSIFPALPR
jgi:hypothetical protein